MQFRKVQGEPTTIKKYTGVAVSAGDTSIEADKVCIWVADYPAGSTGVLALPTGDCIYENVDTLTFTDGTVDDVSAGGSLYLSPIQGEGWTNSSTDEDQGDPTRKVGDLVGGAIASGAFASGAYLIHRDF